MSNNQTGHKQDATNMFNITGTNETFNPATMLRYATGEQVYANRYPNAYNQAVGDAGNYH